MPSPHINCCWRSLLISLTILSPGRCIQRAADNHSSGVALTIDSAASLVRSETFSDSASKLEQLHAANTANTATTPAPSAAGGVSAWLRTGAVDSVWGDNSTTQAPLAAQSMGVHSNSAGDDEALVSSAVYGATSIIVYLTAFHVLRQRFPAIYSSRLTETRSASSSSPAPEPTLLCAGGDLVTTAGLEAVMHVELHKLGIRIFATLGVVLAPLLSIIHWGTDEADKLEYLTRLSLSDTEQRAHVLWIHACAVWIVVAVTLALVFSAQHSFQTQRYEWLQKMQFPQSKTVLVQGLPEDRRTDESLAEYFRGLSAPDAVQRAYVVRRTDVLCKLLKKLEDPSGDFTDEARAELEEEVRQEQERLGNPDTLHAGAAFVTFNSHRHQWLATRADFCFGALGPNLTVEVAPDPYDVIYSTLATPSAGLMCEKILGWCCILLLFFAWIPLVQFVTSWSVLEAWKARFPSLGKVHEDHPVVGGIVEGVLAVLGLQILMAVLPSVVTQIIKHFFGPTSGALIQSWLARIDFAFRYIFVVLAVVVGQGILQCLKQLQENPQSAFSLLAASLPLTSHYYVNFVLIGCSACVMELLRISPLLKYASLRVTGQTDDDKKLEECEEGSVIIGVRYSLTMTIMVISLLFCSLCPAMAWVACIYFSTGYLVYHYLYSSAEPKLPELGGVLWVHALDQLLLGLFTYVVFMIGVLQAHDSGSTAHTISLAPAALVVACAPVVLRKCKYFLWESLPYDLVVQLDSNSTGEDSASEPGKSLQASQKLEASAYRQEECFTARSVPLENPQGL